MESTGPCLRQRWWNTASGVQRGALARVAFVPVEDDGNPGIWAFYESGQRRSHHGSVVRRGLPWCGKDRVHVWVWWEKWMAWVLLHDLNIGPIPGPCLKTLPRSSYPQVWNELTHALSRDSPTPHVTTTFKELGVELPQSVLEGFS